MTVQRTLWTVALLGIGGVALAGCEAAAPSAPPAGSSATSPAVANAVSGSVRQAWQAARKNIADSTELMAEADYAFKPVDTVRSFGQILTHLAGANYVFCSAARGEARPTGPGPSGRVVDAEYREARKS